MNGWDEAGRWNPDLSDRYFEPDGPPSELALMLDELVECVQRYVILRAEQAVAVALWIAHTHVIDAAETTPYLSVRSAEKRSGKSRLLEVLALLVARPLMTANISDAGEGQDVRSGPKVSRRPPINPFTKPEESSTSEPEV